MTKGRYFQVWRWGWVFLLILFGPIAAASQGESAARASIIGTVTDPEGAVVPGVQITVTNTDTGISQTTTTDDLGRYEVHFLIPGPYSLTAAGSGFKTQTYTGIVLTVGQQAVMDLTLQLGKRVETVTVTSATPLVDTSTSDISYLVDDRKMRDLPLNGRDFVQLALLQPGVTDIGGISGVSQVTTGPSGNTNGGKFAVNGLPSKNITYLIDGSDVTDPHGIIPTLGGATGAALGVEAIKEFRIITTNYTAEYGREAGGVIEAIITSGTNQFHGSAFIFHRNDNLDAKNFFDDPDRRIPEFKRNQFGFSLGGPIKRERTFFFANYEGLREDLGVTQSFVAPNLAARQGVLPTGSVVVDPRIAPFLALYPLPNGPDLGDGTGIVNTSATEPIDEDYFVVRIDHQLGKNDRIFGRYLIDDSRFQDPFESTVVPGFPGEADLRNQFFTVSEQKSFSPTIVNEFQFSFNRQKAIALPIKANPGLETSLTPAQALGQLITFGLPALGHNFILPIGQFNNIFQITDNLSVARGRHFLKFGVDIRRVQNNGPFALGFLGQYQFQNLQSFLTAQPTIFLGTVPENADSVRGYRVTDWGIYVQDNFRLASNLTLNLGLRYEGSSNPTEDNGRIANIVNPLTDTAPTAGVLLNSPKDLFGPRIGLAWSPDPKTAVRAGFGIFYTFLNINEYGDTRFLPPFYELALSILPPFLNPLGGPIVLRPFGITIPSEFNYNQPTVHHFNLTIQRAVDANTSVQVAYVGSRGYHLLRSGNINTPVPRILPDGRTFFPPGAPLRNPAFGPMLFIGNDVQSFYHSLQLSMQRRMTQGLQFQGSYTLSKSIDDASGPFLSDFVTGAGPVQDYFCRKCDRARSAWDARHSFVFNWTYDLPLGSGKNFLSQVSGGLGKLVEGWSVGGILSLRSGLPFTPILGFNNSADGSIFFADRPDVVGPCRITGDPAQWFDPSCFRLPPPRTYGNAGRNILTGPDFKNIDFVITKETSINERLRVQFRTEFFNLTNHPNFAPPINSTGFNGRGGNGEIIFNDLSGIPVASAGRVFRTVNTSRQIQFALKFLF